MEKLPGNFELVKYGMHIRLVNENDAEFIVKLRTDPRLGRFINKTDNDIEKQREWIRNYKIREKEGKDYYFIYFYDGIPIGLNRLYDIQPNEFTGGSFVFKKGIPFELPIYAVLFQFDTAFNFLHKELAHGDIRKANKHVVKFHKLLEVNFTIDDDQSHYYLYTKEAFNKRKGYIESLLRNTI